MNKLQLIYFGIAIFFSSCQMENSYRVTGFANRLKDGDSVVLCQLHGRKSSPIDTAISRNGRFEFTGKIDSIQVHEICFKQNGLPVRFAFFLEPGEIRIKVSEKGEKEVKGTTWNEILNKYNHQQDSMSAERAKIYAILYDSVLVDEVRRELEKSVYAKQHASHRYMIQTAKANINNPVGLFLLASRYKGMPINTLDTLVALLPLQYQNNETVKIIKEYVNIERATAVGQPFMDFKMLTLEGKEVKLSDYVYKNKITLLEFWASWCSPCCKSMPDLVRLYRRYKDKGLEIVGVSGDNNKEQWEKAVRRLNITWPQISDVRKGRGDMHKHYGIYKIPTMYLIDQNGTIIAKDISMKEVFSKIGDILK